MIKFVQNVLYYFFILVLFFLFGSLVLCLESRFCCDFLKILKHNHILSRFSLITLYHITIITKNCEHFCNPKLLLTYRKSNWSKPKDSHRGSLFHLSYLPRCSNSCNHMRTCLEALKRKKKLYMNLFLILVATTSTSQISQRKLEKKIVGKHHVIQLLLF